MIACILPSIVVIFPLITAGLSFIGRIAPDSVIPDSFDLYASVPNMVRFTGRVLNQEPLPGILKLIKLAPFVPLLNKTKDSGFIDNRLFRFAAREGWTPLSFLTEKF